jgi:hypothetical protein
MRGQIDPKVGQNDPKVGQNRAIFALLEPVSSAKWLNLPGKTAKMTPPDRVQL